MAEKKHAESAHDAAVTRISHQLTSFHTSKTPYRIYHGTSTNTTRPSSHTRDAIIDTSKLTNILSIDTTARLARCEPNVPMHALARATLPLGLIAPATPEFPMITVGGGFAGTAGESSSFRHGFFDRCVDAVTLALPDGRIVRAEQTGANADLYASAVGSMGTFGVAVELEVRLEPCRPFVRTRYLPVASIADATTVLSREIRNDANDFVDGILYSRTHGVVVVGSFADAHATDTTGQPLPVRRFTRARDQWFYLHAQRASSQPHPRADLIPTFDYLFRYDRSAFWMGAHAFPLFHTPFFRLTRALLDPLLRTRRLYAALHHSGYAQRFVLQDLILPFDAAAPFVDWLDATLGIYPLWLCPIDARGCTAPMHAPRRPGEEFFLNVGVWGPGRRGYADGTAGAAAWERDNRAIEERVAQLQGRKWLYAQVFAGTEDEFWQSQGIDGAAYAAARERWGAGLTPSVFDKVRWRGEVGDVSKVRGLVRLFLKRDAVLKA